MTKAKKNTLTLSFMNSWLQDSAVHSVTVNPEPFPHFIIDNFLVEDKLDKLIAALSAEEFIYKEADLFQFKQTNDLAGTDNVFLQELRSFLCSPDFVKYMEAITGLQLKTGVVDLAGTMYEDTDFLLCHDDKLDERKVAFLLYLTDMEDGDGGSLNLLSEKDGAPDNVVEKIIPKCNRFAVFEVSEISFHEVEEIVADKQRVALGGWLHGR